MPLGRERRSSIPKNNPPSPARVKQARENCCRFLGELTRCKDEKISERSVETGLSDYSENNDVDYVELQYKRPKKVFRTKEEQQEFVRNYTAKKKTEVFFSSQ